MTISRNLASFANNLDTSGNIAGVNISLANVSGTLAVTSGGTGTTSATFVNLTSNVSGTLAVSNGGTGATTSTGSGNVVLSTSPTLVTPLLGTPTSGNLINATGLSLTTGVTGTLPVVNGGTGSNTLAGANIASLSSINTFTGGQRGAVTALTSSGGSVAINLAANNNFSYTTAENSTLAAPSNPVAGQSGIIVITQGATSRLLAYNSFFKFAGGTIPVLTTTVGAVDTFAYYVESATRATCQLIKDVK